MECPWKPTNDNPSCLGGQYLPANDGVSLSYALWLSWLKFKIRYRQKCCAKNVNLHSSLIKWLLSCKIEIKNQDKYIIVYNYN